MSKPEPEVVTFVSGKGGVGKTMLAVAFARELSQANKTLILDLDFFNRGLTGLLRRGKKIMSIHKPGFLEVPGEERKWAEWELLEVGHNVFHVTYPDLSDAEIRLLETVTVDELSSSLRDYLHYVAEVSGVTLIVLDCHGGPDHLSFAACSVANVSILVSEPDKITFYGTMHFVRQLENTTSPEATKSLYLIFNKVVPAFSANYLTRFYNNTVRALFADKPLLSIIPLEVYLTKEFENTPFLTDVYPYSALAKKMRLVAFDLFHKSHPELLPTSFRRMNWVDQLLTRVSLAKVPIILNLNLIMAVITVTVTIGVFLAQVIVKSYDTKLYDLALDVRRARLIDRFDQGLKPPPVCAEQRGKSEQIACVERICTLNQLDDDCPIYITSEPTVLMKEVDAISEDRRCIDSPDSELKALARHIRDEGKSLRGERLRVFLAQMAPWFYGVIVAWFINALVLNWSAQLDRRFTYEMRSSRYVRGGALLLVVLGIWGLYSFYYGVIFTVPGTPYVLFALAFLPIFFVALNQTYKAIMELWKERRYAEGVIRAVFVVSIVAQVMVVRHFAHSFF